jgi:hypothetical protein
MIAANAVAVMNSALADMLEWIWEGDGCSRKEMVFDTVIMKANTKMNSTV